MWDIHTGQVRQHFKEGMSTITSVAFAPHGKLLATGGYKAVSLWDATSGKRTVLLRHNNVRAVAFTNAGRTLASGSLDGTIRLWDVSKIK